MTIKELQVKKLRNDIAHLRAIITQGKDYDGSLVKQAERKMIELDNLTKES